jgi:hypothetical protein
VRVAGTVGGEQTNREVPVADEDQLQPDGPPPLRASDEDRQRVADALRVHTSAGRLTLAEFEQRVADAYAAKTVAELRPLVADLPVDVASLLPTEPSAVRKIAPLPWMPQGTEAEPYRRAPVAHTAWVRPVFIGLGILFVLTTLGAMTEVGPAAWPLLVVAFIMFGRSGRRHRH